MNATTTQCSRAESIVARANDFGFEADTQYGTDDEGAIVDLTIAGTWSEFDDNNRLDGWRVGFALRWYNVNGRWRLAGLDGKSNRPVGGLAERYDGRTSFTFWLTSVRYLESLLEDPDEFIVWLDKMAPR